MATASPAAPMARRTAPSTVADRAVCRRTRCLPRRRTGTTPRCRVRRRGPCAGVPGGEDSTSPAARPLMAVPVATPCSTRATTRDGTPSAVQKTADQERCDQHRAASEAVTLRPDRQQGAEQPPDVHGEDDGDHGVREMPAFPIQRMERRRCARCRHHHHGGERRHGEGGGPSRTTMGAAGNHGCRRIASGFFGINSARALQ